MKKKKNRKVKVFIDPKKQCTKERPCEEQKQSTANGNRYLLKVVHQMFDPDFKPNRVEDIICGHCMKSIGDIWAEHGVPEAEIIKRIEEG